MKCHSIILALTSLTLTSLAAETKHTDLLQFRNGDALHGTFLGLDGSSVKILRDDVDAPLRIKQTNLSVLSFNGGKPRTHLQENTFITLNNGDVLPGKIISLDDTSLVIDSAVAGQLNIPRQEIRSLNPSPAGGNLIYSGPYTTTGWSILIPRQDDEEEKENADEKKEKEDKEEKKKKEQPKHWSHSGAAWYNIDNSPLLNDIGLGDVTKLTFKLKWKNRLNATLIFHADLKRPLIPADNEEEEQNDEGEKPDPAEDEEENEEPEPLQWESLTDVKPPPWHQPVSLAQKFRFQQQPRLQFRLLLRPHHEQQLSFTLPLLLL